MRKLRHDEIPRLSPTDIHGTARHPVTILIDNVRSLYNVGAIFRTSDAALVERLILTGITGTPENRGLHKTALGSQDTVPWVYKKDSLAAVKALKTKRLHYCCTGNHNQPHADHQSWTFDVSAVSHSG